MIKKSDILNLSRIHFSGRFVLIAVEPQQMILLANRPLLLSSAVCPGQTHGLVTRGVVLMIAKCENCNKDFESYIHAGKQKRFCCKKCQKAAKDKKYIHPKSRAFETKPGYQEKQKVRYKINQMVKKGLISKPDKCELCNSTGKRIEAHHPFGYDGENANKIQWLCCDCHVAQHRGISPLAL